MQADDFDAARAKLEGPDLFQRFRVSGPGTPLSEAALPRDAELLVFDRGGVRGALLVQQMVYHHAAQGELDGEPYVVSF